jgi:hypothetical protein
MLLLRTLILFSVPIKLTGFQLQATRLPGIFPSKAYPGLCLSTSAGPSNHKKRSTNSPVLCVNEGSPSSVGGQPSNILKGLIFAITGNFGQDRDSVVAMIKDLGAGDLSPTVHKRVNFLVADDGAVSSETKHIRKAVKYGVKIVSTEYLKKCRELNTKVDSTPYLYQVTLSSSKEDQAD